VTAQILDRTLSCFRIGDPDGVFGRCYTDRPAICRQIAVGKGFLHGRAAGKRMRGYIRNQIQLVKSAIEFLTVKLMGKQAALVIVGAADLHFLFRDGNPKDFTILRDIEIGVAVRIERFIDSDLMLHFRFGIAYHDGGLFVNGLIAGSGQGLRFDDFRAGMTG